MAQQAVKVKAHKRLSGTGKVEDVNAHLRKLKASAVKFTNELKNKKAVMALEAEERKLASFKAPDLSHLTKEKADAVVFTLRNKQAMKVEKLRRALR